MEKFEKGMSIVQLEERYEMAAAGRERSTDTEVEIGGGNVGVRFSFQLLNVFVAMNGQRLD